MKRKLINLPSGFFMTALMLVFVTTSCTKKTSDLKQTANPEEIASAAAGKPSAPPEVHLRMTINNAGNNITSDNLGDYVHGSQNVSVYFSTGGNLQFTNATSSKPSVPIERWFNVNLNSPQPSYNARGVLQSGFIATLATLTSPDATPLQSLPINGYPKCISFSAGVNGGVINFHRNSYEDTPNSQSSYVYVKRTSETTWVMTSVLPASGGCSALSAIAAFRNQATLYGYYNIPFSFTLTKIP